MPSSGPSPKSSESSKRKLQDALLLLADRPDGVADISYCSVAKLPKDFFQVCAVYLKTRILIRGNLLKDLETGGKVEELPRVKVLDVQSNRIEKLPLSFGLQFPSLLELNLSDNHLKVLPASLSNCLYLRSLIISRNKFHEVPEVICEVRSLEELDLSGNAVLKLPVAFSNLRKLKTFNFDIEGIIYPTKVVCEKGIDAMMLQFFRDTGGVSCDGGSSITAALPVVKKSMSLGLLGNPNEEAGDVFSGRGRFLSCTDEVARYQAEELRMQNAIARYANDDKFKREDVMKFHASMAEDDRKHVEIIQRVKLREQELLLRSLREREQVESDLQKLTESVELGKKSLLDALRFMEGHSQRLLAQLTSQSEERAKQVKFYEEELRKSDLSWKTLLPKLEISKRNLVLSAMKAHLKEDNHFITTYKRLVEVSKNEVDRMINAHKAEEKLFGPLLAKKQVEQENIINGLLEDENVQREMFRVLQLRSDAVHNRILCDLVMLENELTTLSLLEVQQTEDRGAIIKKSLEDERMELAKMYQRLTKEREHREAYLKGVPSDMEREAQKHTEEFWLAQYSRLMEIIPETLKEQPRVKTLQVDLDPKTSKGKPASTKPHVSSGLPEVLHLETICTVCMDRSSTEIFLPCGHICCCKICGEKISECPLCRVEIKQMLTLNVSAE